ncbi:MAG: ATP-binding cassette domain-containing protein [Oceanospirillaceae bacterium]|jgi:putative ABC transport system ATP-binding protein|nr:ATP-binding cassette domain-containing protein [Oceanospirillaceae bacterium]MBT4998065.1 ATP-binding cassette domain-containing protein [Oceanospirillaceae bacterium]MBT5629938.1 ATP-binding cassette domain-containing protein [Oceanospirillaceae bacterium]MBT6100011.1 ATP-binding cassette domain-containing protein [Oceanospirillaceae bacterium]MBT7330500.1 ATP-binding cassette domain-containing protein [Oceanospirillaceae bacterium]
MPNSTPFLAARNVSQIVANPQATQADDLHILDDVNFTIEAGESVAIVGASGSGKTTLLGMMAGLDSPSHGQLFLANKDLTKLDEEGRAELRKHQVSFIFQNFQLLPSLTAIENIMLPLEVKGSSDANTLATQYLNHVGLAQRGHHYPNQLSGGEQQRVAIARAFAAQAPILFADEPTGNLDTQTGDHIVELLFELNQQHHTTLVLVTHDLNLAQRCQRRLTLNAGQLTERLDA